MKLFKSQIFYGASTPKGTGQTEKEMKELEEQILHLQWINSGLQQPCHCSSPKQHEKCIKSFKESLKLKKELGKSIKTALDI